MPVEIISSQNQHYSILLPDVKVVAVNSSKREHRLVNTVAGGRHMQKLLLSAQEAAIGSKCLYHPDGTHYRQHHCDVPW